MGRSEAPLDPQAGPAAQLALELRTLRDQCGRPTYRTMAERVGVSAATLSRAASGQSLPTLQVLLAYVEACGADPLPWHERWHEAAERQQDSASRDGTAAPYLGLARYDVADAERFFGRETLVAELWTLVQRERVVVVTGPSGAGKSSVVRAGLVPALTRTAQTADGGRVQVVVPGPDPVAVLDGCGLSFGTDPAGADGDPDGPDGDPDGADAGGIDVDGIGDVLVVDQLEELWSLGAGPTARTAFLDRLLGFAVSGRNRVVLCVRADHFGRLAEHPGVAAAIGGGTLLVPAMTPDELREAIVRPAVAAGLLVERRLTGQILADLAGSAAPLPALSHALLEVWRRRHGRTLRFAAYEEIGGVHGAIGRTAERLFGQLSPRQAQLAHRLLLRLVAPGDHEPDGRRPAALADLVDDDEPDVWVVLDTLAEGRLVTVDESQVELTHEALIQAWPRLAGWVESDRELLVRHRSIGESTRSWLRDRRDPDLLLRGARLNAAAELLELRDGPVLLSAAEREFLTAGVEARDQVRRAEELVRRRSRRLWTALVAAAVVVAVVGGLAAREGLVRRSTQVEADAVRVAALADGIRTTDGVLADLLSVAAYRLADTAETRDAVLTAATRPERAAVPLPPGITPDRVLVSPQSRWVMAAGSGQVTRIDPVTGERRADPGIPARLGMAATVTRDGRLALVSTDKAGLVWDVAAGRQVTRVWPEHEYPISFDGSARGVVLLSVDGREILVRDLADGSVRMRWPTGGSRLVWVTPSRDRRLLSVCMSGQPVRVLVVPGGDRAPESVRLDDAARCSAGSEPWFDDASERMAMSSAADGTGVWDLASGRQLMHLPTFVDAVALSPSGGQLLTLDGSIGLWQVASGARTMVYRPTTQLPFQPGWVDERTVRYVDGGVVRMLDVSRAVSKAAPDRELTQAVVASGGAVVGRVHQAPEGYRVELQRYGSARLEAAGPAATVTVQPGPDTQPFLALAADGRTALIAVLRAPGGDAWQRRLVLRSVPTGQDTVLDLGPGDPVVRASLSPDGRRVAVVRGATANAEPGRRTLEAWDVATRSLLSRTVSDSGIDRAWPTFVPSGDRLVTNAGLLDVRTGRPVTAAAAAFPLGVLPDIQVAMSPDQRFLAAGQLDGRVQLWDASTWTLRAVLSDSAADSPWSQTDRMRALAFSPDGRLVAALGAGNLTVWDVATGRLRGAPIPTSDVDARAFAFTGNDQVVVVGRGTEVVDLRLSTAVRAVCARAGRDLRADEWRRYLTGERRPTC